MLSGSSFLSRSSPPDEVRTDCSVDLRTGNLTASSVFDKWKTDRQQWQQALVDIRSQLSLGNPSIGVSKGGGTQGKGEEDAGQLSYLKMQQGMIDQQQATIGQLTKQLADMKGEFQVEIGEGMLSCRNY